MSNRPIGITSDGNDVYRFNPIRIYTDGEWHEFNDIDAAREFSRKNIEVPEEVRKKKEKRGRKPNKDKDKENSNKPQ